MSKPHNSAASNSDVPTSSVTIIQEVEIYSYESSVDESVVSTPTTLPSSTSENTVEETIIDVEEWYENKVRAGEVTDDDYFEEDSSDDDDIEIQVKTFDRQQSSRGAENLPDDQPSTSSGLQGYEIYTYQPSMCMCSKKATVICSCLGAVYCSVRCQLKDGDHKKICGAGKPTFGKSM